MTKGEEKTRSSFEEGECLLHVNEDQFHELIRSLSSCQTAARAAEEE